MKGKSLIGVILAAICVTVTYLLPGSEELSHEGITALGVLGMASILWISNTLPFGVTGLLALVMLVLLGVSDMASVFVGFSNSSVIFVITVFCLTAAVMNTKLTLRLINKLLRWAGSSAEKLVLAYMAAAALLSSVMSNVPVTVLFLGLAQPVLKAVGAKPGSSRLGKCLMIGIPFAAVNGGMATPAGSSFNVLAMGVFESIAGKPLTFLQWMAVGLPTAIVATLVCWICLVKIFKPEAINEECSASIREEAENAGKISAYEKKVLFMLVAMPVLWILGTWFPALDVTVVSIIGFVVMFMPGINILTWKQFEESVPWNIILMINSCEVYLENVVLDESALVGKKGRGFFQLMKNFEVERLMSTAMNVGMAQAAYEEAARYATERVQFGKTIGSFQLTQEKIINMAIKIENMRNMVYHYAWMKQNGMSIATESAMAKYYTSRAAFEVVDDAMQIMGGIGYTNDVRIARLWRDCRLSRIMAGTDEIMVHIAGRALLKEFANK